MKPLTLIDKVFILKGSSLFSSLDLELLLPIADKLTSINFNRANPIFTIGEKAHRIFFLVKGTVLIKDQEGKALATIHPPDFFGDEALFSEQKRAYSAICQSDALLLVLSHTHLLSIISECPSVAIGLINAYASMTEFRFRKE
jgi:CRP/FNR family cyclic AMP-dependent transcriptional regulator